MRCNKNFPSASRRVVSGEVTSGLIAQNYVKERCQNGGQKKKDTEGPCQIRVAPGLGFLGQGLSGVRSCSLVGSWGMMPAQQGGESDPLTRRVVDPREGSLNPPQRTVEAPAGRFPSRFGLPARVRQHLLH
jgi:hypothetical protein